MLRPSIRSQLVAVALCAAAISATAAPIRVGIFKSYGQGRYWHTNIHTAGVTLVSILANPDSASLGPDLVLPAGGFIATQYGKLTGNGTTTNEQESPFFDALDSLDVVIFPSITDMGNVIEGSHPTKRLRLLQHFATKGVVSIHSTTDSYGTWPAWDSLHGARFQNHPTSDRNATVRLDTLSGRDASWHLLNRGLADTTFLEEWFSFTTNASVIRTTPGLKTTVNVDESTYAGGLSGARAMGADHPLSWYREFPEGGRFFYTALGHRANLYQGGAQPRFLRRQLYNAILWAAGVDSTGAVSVRGGVSGRETRLTDFARTGISGRTLTVSLFRDGPHTIELRGLDGRRVDVRKGTGRVEHAFVNLRPGVHVVAVTTPEGRYTRRVMVP